MVMIVSGNKTFWVDGYLKANLDMLKVQIKKDWDFCIIIDGIERCLAEDTLIKTNKGDKYIKELMNKTFTVSTYNIKKNKEEEGKATVIDTGKQTIYEIETEDGRKVQATKNHTFFIKRNEKIIEIKLKDLKEGEELICNPL